MTATLRPVRRPAWHHHDVRPDGEGLAITEWGIETLLALAHDYDEDDLLTVLRCFRPELDDSITNDIERLLDLAEEVAAAESFGPTSRYYAAVDDYCDALHQLAVLMRSGGVR